MNITCSVVHIKKCLMNLVLNGVEAISGPGKVLVSTRNQTVDAENGERLHIAPGQYVVVVVSDTGTGVSDADRQQIFEPFYTKKKLGRSGTGLGLAIVWNTMKDHKGTVTVESSSEGSSFSLYFPVSAGQVSEKGSHVDLQHLQGQGETVLVVDDDALQRDIAVKMLTLLEYTPRAVASGEEAVATFDQGAVDLILLDMLMEPGMNGCQTYAEIIKRHPGQKAVIASGFSESEDVRRACLLGAGGFIKKPYPVEQLGQMVQKVLKG
ncbi:MAG: response regulator [Desulfobulbaceae bacterium]